MPVPLYGLTRAELTAQVEAWGFSPAHAVRLWRYLYWECADSLEAMPGLPAKVRAKLAAEASLGAPAVARELHSSDGFTRKFLLELADARKIETVLMRFTGRVTACISSQAGCAMGCVFCASGLDGVARNLTAGEIVEQMLLLDRLLPDAERLSHIVVMGMGEPLANLERLLTALADASDPTGLGISPRRITISTVGLPPAMRRLSELGCHYNLAVSLHAPDDLLRNRLVPVNKNIGLADILSGADQYFETSGRRLTFEYVLLGDVNDRPEHARGLAALLAGRTA
ncbi:MAG TPA: 23S rRNA (adenine(2503)-C(2))-methyltransferase RlmN, partial [Opitutaceae bacterium]|nr:23S rRNA (adenine(2503)-C(2))-methyltransferase RlmN [Opitutaceae bacterium]